MLFKHLEVELFWTNAHRLIDENTFEWTNGEKLQYTNWKNSESEEKKTINYCVAVNLEKGFWLAEDCFARLPFVCEFYANGKEVPSTALALEDFPGLYLKSILFFNSYFRFAPSHTKCPKRN